MAENLHDRKDTKIERKSNEKVIRVIELDLLNCPLTLMRTESKMGSVALPM